MQLPGFNADDYVTRFSKLVLYFSLLSSFKTYNIYYNKKINLVTYIVSGCQQMLFVLLS